MTKKRNFATWTIILVGLALTAVAFTPTAAAFSSEDPSIVACKNLSGRQTCAATDLEGCEAYFYTTGSGGCFLDA